LAVLLSVSAAPAAHALRCSTWNRLTPAQRNQAIARMIEDGLRSSNARRYDINEARVRACLQGQAASMQLDFDGACAERADLQVLNRIFKNYAWSCIE
jgi:hypothetical protein